MLADQRYKKPSDPSTRFLQQHEGADNCPLPILLYVTVTRPFSTLIFLPHISAS